MTCKYSILIPTRNGAAYLPYAVRTVLDQKYSDCEVIVSVNHSSDNSLELLKQFDDPRLKVLVPPRPLSMTKHFEWLLHHAQGEWIAYIGDDDGVMPYFFEEMDQILLRWLGIKSVAAQGAFYNWYSGKVDYTLIRTEKLVGSQAWLLKMYAELKKYPDLPSLYTAGVTHISLIKRILEQSKGQFFHDLAPDVYSGVAIAAQAGQFLRIETPLFWRGTSPKSVGMSHILSAYGTADAQMQQRAREFQEMSEQDGIRFPQHVHLPLWLYAISPYIIYTARCQIPFKTSLFKGKWLSYLVYTSILKKIHHLYRAGVVDQAKVLEKAYQRQLELTQISPAAIRAVAFLQFKVVLPLKFLPRWYRSIKRRIKKPARQRLFAESKERFPTLTIASQEVLKLYQKASASVVKF